MHIVTISTTRTQIQTGDRTMNQKAQLFGWQVMITIITLGSFFFDVSKMGVDHDPFVTLVLFIMLALFSVFLGFVNQAFCDALAALAMFFGCLAFFALTVPFGRFVESLTIAGALITVVIGFAALITLITGFVAFVTITLPASSESFVIGKETDLTKRYVFFSLVVEFIVIATPMLWYVSTHQEQIKVAIVH